MLGLTIKSTTMECYMHAAAELSTTARLMDPQLNIFGKTADPVNKVLWEQRCWESVPNQRHPVTTPMVLYMRDLAKNAHPDSFYAALYDWNVLGCVHGFSLSEWAQNDEDKKDYPKFNIDGTPLAFAFDDFKFYGPCEKHIKQDFNRNINPRDVTSGKCTWRYQKN